MGRFKYTTDYGTLNDDQRRFYEDNGYILIKNNISNDLIDELQQRFVDICNGKIDTGFMTVMEDLSLKRKGMKGEFVMNKIQDILFDDVFYKYPSNDALVGVVESIIGPNITAINSMIINKPPDANPNSSLHPLHQDLHYFPWRPAERSLASWTAMEDVNQRNGCLYVVPGTHKGELLPHAYPKGYKTKLYPGIEGLENLPKLYLEMEKGDTVFFHPILLHGSGPNFTNGFRKAISCHFADSHSYFIDLKGTSQEQICTEIEQIFAKRGLAVPYNDIWKTKSRLIRGSPGVFQNFWSSL